MVKAQTITPMSSPKGRAGRTADPLLITLRQSPTDGSWRASTPSPFPESATNPEGAYKALQRLARAIFPEQR